MCDGSVRIVGGDDDEDDDEEEEGGAGISLETLNASPGHVRAVTPALHDNRCCEAPVFDHNVAISHAGLGRE